MVTYKKIGIILVLVGSFWFLISFVLIPGYSPALGFIAHLNNMTTREIVLKEGRWLQFPDGYVPPPLNLNLDTSLLPFGVLEDSLYNEQYGENGRYSYKRYLAEASSNISYTDWYTSELKKYNSEREQYNANQLKYWRDDLENRATKEYQEKYIDPLKNFTSHYEGRITIPYKYLFILNITIIFAGLGMLILSKQATQG